MERKSKIVMLIFMMALSSGMQGKKISVSLANYTNDPVEAFAYFDCPDNSLSLAVAPATLNTQTRQIEPSIAHVTAKEGCNFIAMQATIKTDKGEVILKNPRKANDDLFFEIRPLEKITCIQWSTTDQVKCTQWQWSYADSQQRPMDPRYSLGFTLTRFTANNPGRVVDTNFVTWDK